MGRKKGETTKVTDRSEVYCCGCDTDKKTSDFYKSYGATKSGLLPLCKKCCIKLSLDKKNNFNMDNFQSMLQQVDRPFLKDIWQDNLLKYKNKTPNTLIGFYFKNLGLVQYRELKWKDSEFETKSEKENSNKDSINKDLQEDELIQNLDLLKEKFGYGYDEDEYVLFEKKYQDLRPSFQLTTTMHEECLREYCIDKVKEGLAKARGDFKEAKEWASMAKEQANSGKLNPSQMTKADLSGGLDTFGQMRRMVEQTPEGEIMKILPIFMQKPKDRVDITLWLYVNYARDLKGMEECTYEDIWNFYNKRVAEYEKKMIDPLEKGENNE